MIGFTDWLGIDNQDAITLGWLEENQKEDMQTAYGEAQFNLYQETIFFDEGELIIPVLGGNELQDILLGVR
ncbi:MAG: hypothetical protein ACKO3K_02055 [Cuspidothrix sp.]